MPAKFKFAALIVLMALLGTSRSLKAQETPDTFDLDRIIRSTVYIMQTRSFGDDTVVCIGSGTIVSRDGLIVTNAHNTVTNVDCPGTSIVVSVSLRPNEPPVPRYRAEVAQTNAGLDLALIRITRDLDGRLLDSSTFALPFVELADSSAVALDATISVFGYPGIGNDPVSTVRGTITGFVAEPSGGDRSWLKTNAPIPGTMTGGGVYNQAGQLIAIPTTAPVRAEIVSDTTCTSIEDTNRDGLINSSDTCVAVGGFINALRPSDFVRPSVRGASLGLNVEKLTGESLELQTGGNPGFNNLFFASAVNQGMPTSVVNSMSTGTSSLYLFFDYDNMTPETIYELRVARDDIPDPIFGLAPVRWSGGESGLWYIGNNEQVWPNGIYEFTLFINGLASGRATILVSGAPEPAPSFSNLFFGVQDQNGNQYGNAYVLGTGTIVTATFLYRNMQVGIAWSAIWYYNGVEQTRVEETWEGDSDGLGDTSIQDPNGLQPGRYRLELYIDNRLAAKSDFIVAGARQDAFPRVFTNERFTSASSLQDALVADPVSNFPETVAQIYGLFDWERISPGTLWTMRWLVDDEVFYEETAPWNTADNGQNYATRLSAVGGQLPDGTYRMELAISSVLLASIEAEVGIGQLPIDRFASASGVQLRGQIIDADTGQGIPGVTFVLITEDFSVSDFLWRQEQVYALATTDQNGRFQIDRPLEFDAPYSVIVSAEGYLIVSADGFTVDEETDNPLEIVIPLSHD